MKKFLIFLLGIAVAVIGYFVFIDKPLTPEQPPINNEQQQPGDNTGDDNTGDATPDDPSDVGGEVTYAQVGMATQFASVYFYDAAHNATDSNHLIVGENYTMEVIAFEGYVVQDWWVDFCDGNMYQSNITFFTATEQMYIAVNAYEYVAPVTATMTANFPQDVLMFTVSGNGGSTEYSMLPSGTCELIPGSWVQFSMNPNAYDYVIDSIIVDGNYILMGGSAGQDFSYVQFYVPETNFTIEATIKNMPATYAIQYDGTACTSVEIMDTTGQYLPATYQTGFEYGLKFQAPEGVYVTEIWLNDRLIQTYEAGGIASGIATFTTGASENMWNFRIVTTGEVNTTTYATVNATYDSSAIRLSFQNQYGGTQNINELIVGQEYMYFINIIGDGVSLESVTLNGTTSTYMQGSFVATETIDITITHTVN